MSRQISVGILNSETPLILRGDYEQLDAILRDYRTGQGRVIVAGPIRITREYVTYMVNQQG